jgi:hypothetical protein
MGTPHTKHAMAEPLTGAGGCQLAHADQRLPSCAMRLADMSAGAFWSLPCLGERRTIPSKPVPFHVAAAWAHRPRMQRHSSAAAPALLAWPALCRAAASRHICHGGMLESSRSAQRRGRCHDPLAALRAQCAGPTPPGRVRLRLEGTLRGMKALVWVKSSRVPLGSTATKRGRNSGLTPCRGAGAGRHWLRAVHVRRRRCGGPLQPL